MTQMLTANMQRMNRFMRSAAPSKATRSFQKAITGHMIDTAFAPMTAFTPKPAKRRKAAEAKTDRKLGTVIKQLNAAKSAKPAAIPRATGSLGSPRIPFGAQDLARKHRSAAGARSYRLYLPASHPARPKGLILMLHGCDQTADDFALGTHMNALAEKHGLAVAYPTQSGRHNRASCWNWFKPTNQVRGMGEPAILASLTRKLMREFGIQRDNVFVAGLSAGGSMAAILADVYPDVFSAAGIHSGLARGSAQNVLSAMSAMRKGGDSAGTTPAVATLSKPVRRIVFQGDNDGTVHPSNASTIVAAAMGGDATPLTTTKRSVRGRGYARSNFAGPDGAVQLELWMLEGAGHAWSGGCAAGSYSDSRGPDASAQMVRFFLTQAS